jgi:choline-phosphate cytidylyltransferase
MIQHPYMHSEDTISKPIRVYADGVFDLLHLGHANMLFQAKTLFPIVHLMVGVCKDADVTDGKRSPIMSYRERVELIRHIQWVDEIIDDAPWIIDAEFLEKHDIDYVAHDDLPCPSSVGANDDVYEFAKAAGKFKATKRTPGICTTDIIARIADRI